MFFEFFERIKSGFKLLKPSFAIIHKHRPLIVFAVLKVIALISIGSLVIFGYFLSMVGFMMYVSKQLPQTISVPLGTILAFVWVFFPILVIRIINNYFNIAIINYVAGILNHTKTSIGSSLKLSFHKILPIIRWSIVSSAAIMLRKFLGHERRSTSVLGETLYVAWATGTIFVEPIIARENLSLMDSIKKSATLIKNAFGEVIGASTGFAFLKGVITMVGALYLYMFIKTTKNIEFTSTSSMIITAIIIVGLFLLFELISLADYIFRTAVYQYAVNKNSGPFSEHLIKTSFIKHKK